MYKFEANGEETSNCTDEDFKNNVAKAKQHCKRGDVFQLVLSNSQPMNDVAVYTNALGDWNGGSIYFGFNMYRVF